MTTKKGDLKTWLATAGEGISTLASNFYWGVYLCNLIRNWSEGKTSYPSDDISQASVSVGCALAALSLGAMYSHQKLNASYQDDENTAKDDLSKILESDIVDFTDGLSDKYSGAPFVNITETGYPSSYHSHLSILQKLALGTRYLTHTGNISGAMTAGATLFTRLALKDSLTLVGSTLIVGISTLFAALSSIADFRNCKNAMNGEGYYLKDNEVVKADKWTNIGTVGEGFADALSTFYWASDWVETIMELLDEAQNNKDEQSDLSLYIGAGFMVLALFAMYAHRKLNISGQYAQPENHMPHHSHHSHSHHSHEPLSCFQKFTLGVDLLTHTAEVAGTIAAGVNLLDKTLPPLGKALSKLIGTLFAIPPALANVRSCEIGMVKQQRLVKKEESSSVVYDTPSINRYK